MGVTVLTPARFLFSDDSNSETGHKTVKNIIKTTTTYIGGFVYETKTDCN